MSRRILVALALMSLVCRSRSATGSYPTFDYRTRMRVLLLPAELRPGSVVYRLRGTDADFDYPLRFSVADDVGKSIIRIENMPCNPTHTYCQANVFLTRKLEPDRVYDLILSLKDSAGRETKVDSTVKATRAATHFEDIFPYVPGVIMVPESTKIGAPLDFVLARRNPSNSHHSYLELWGSEKFRIVQNTSTKDVTNGSIVLTGSLDFEEKSMYTLHIFCLDPYTKTEEDTRNIAGFQVAVIVEDDQDMPPVFGPLPPVTRLADGTQVGDEVLRVQAQDGDRGNPRPVRYALVSEANPLASYFNISDKTGEIVLAKPLKELRTMVKNNQPVLLTVMAEEVKKNLWEPPAMTSTTQVAILVDNEVKSNSPPYFQNEQYSARIAENAAQGTTLVFGEPYSTSVKDDDAGRDGVFSLSLENNNGTFEVSPAIGEQKANFVIRVRNNRLLDYEERTYVLFTIVAKELTAPTDGGTPLSSKADVFVYLDDENDNPPVFLQGRYEAEIPENVTAGTVITQVQATDVDTGVYGRVFYTNILGNINQSLVIDSTTGVITVATNNHGFDRESAQEYRLMVEARDMEGMGNRATVPLAIKLLDVNDETPQFERQTFEFILQPNLRNFTSRAFVKATDKDAEKPNNIVRYEIMSGNYENKFVLNEVTGELSIRGKLSNTNLRQTENENQFYEQQYDKKDSDFHDEEISVIVLTVRAYDLGKATIWKATNQNERRVPHRWQHTYVRIYPPESRARTMKFIVSGSNPDRKRIEELLRQLTGGRVTIQDIRPYTGHEREATDLSSSSIERDSSHKSVVSATVFYDGNSFVDLNQVEKRLTQNKTQAIVEAKVTEYKNENRVLFWLLMFFLILIILILLTLVLCCIWQGCCLCPWFEFDRKRILVSPKENIKFIAHERNQRNHQNDIQAVTYYGRREAWSGHDHNRSFYNEKKVSREKLVRQTGMDSSEGMGATYRSHSNNENGGPNVIYTQEFVRKEKERNPTMVIEDVEVNPSGDRGPKEKSRRYVPDLDSDSVRRHEMERDSDMDKSYRKSEESPEKRRMGTGYPKSHTNVIKEYRVVLERSDDPPTEETEEQEQEESNREQYYIRQGNAEILRLVTRGNKGEMPQGEEEAFVKLDRGKDIIMKKFMEDQKQTESFDFQQELLRRLQKEAEERNSDASYQNRSVVSDNTPQVRPPRRRNVPFGIYNLQTTFNQETQSLPGQIEMSTQTEREFGTQTEELMSFRPPRRKVRSDNEFSEEEDDDEEEHMENAVEALDLGKGWVRRDAKAGRGKRVKRYKMRTPILEEGEVEAGIKYDTRPAMFKIPESISNGSGTGGYSENKSSILRRRKMREKIQEDERMPENDDNSSEDERNFGRGWKTEKKERLENGKDEDPGPLNRLYEVVQELGEQELHTITVETKERAASLNRLYNALAAFEKESREDMKRSNSLNSLKNRKGHRKAETPTTSSEKSPNPGATNAEESRKEQETIPDAAPKENVGSFQSVEETEKTLRGKKSKYMDWYLDLNKKKTRSERKKEDDLDSGIVMSFRKNAVSLDAGGGQSSRKNGAVQESGRKKSERLLEKKSVFAIAYDGMRTKTIRPETNSSEKC